MSHPIGSATPSKIRLAWAVACMAACLAGAAYWQVTERIVNPSVAHQFGANLLPAIVLATVLQLVFGRNSPRWARWVGFVVIYGTLVGSAAVGAVRQHQQVALAMEEINRSLTMLVYSADVREQPEIDIRPTATGVAGRLEAGIKSALRRTQQLQHDYLMELGGIGWDRLLAAERLSSDPSLAESKLMIRQAGLILEKYRTRSDESVALIRKDMMRIDVPQYIKEPMMKSYDESAAIADGIMHEGWRLEAQALEEMGRVIELLENCEGGWLISEGNLLFAEDSAVSEFNLRIANIGRIASRQMELQSQRLERATSSFSQAADAARLR